MNRSRFSTLWVNIQRVADRLVQQLFGFGQRGAWIRFLLLPVVVVLVFLISSQVGILIDEALKMLQKTPGPEIVTTPTVTPAVTAVPVQLPWTPPRAPIHIAVGNLWSEIGGERIQLGLLALMALWLSYRLVSGYVYWIYNLRNFRQAEQMISSIFLPFRQRRIVIQNGKEISQGMISIRSMYGGQSQLTVNAQDGYAALLERPDHSIRVVGPQDRYPLILDGFMYLRQLIDLRDQNIVVSLKSQTREGIPVTVQDVAFICRLEGVNKVSGQNLYASCNPMAIHALVFLQSLGQTWEDPKERQTVLEGFITKTLSEFISGRSFIEILSETNEYSAICPPVPKSDRLFTQYASNLELYAGQTGLELIWAGQGEWRLSDQIAPELIQRHASQAAQNRLRSQPNAIRYYDRASQRREMSKLVQNLLHLYERGQKSGQSNREIVNELLNYYKRIMQQAAQISSSTGNHPGRWTDI
jgi:hypothetical protein